MAQKVKTMKLSKIYVYLVSGGYEEKQMILTKPYYRPLFGLDLLLLVRLLFFFSGFAVGVGVTRNVGSAPRILVRPSANCSVTIGLAAGLNLKSSEYLYSKLKL